MFIKILLILLYETCTFPFLLDNPYSTSHIALIIQQSMRFIKYEIRIISIRFPYPIAGLLMQLFEIDSKKISSFIIMAYHYKNLSHLSRFHTYLNQTDRILCDFQTFKALAHIPTKMDIIDLLQLISQN